MQGSFNIQGRLISDNAAYKHGCYKAKTEIELAKLKSPVLLEFIDEAQLAEIGNSKMGFVIKKPIKIYNGEKKITALGIMKVEGNWRTHEKIKKIILKSQLVRFYDDEKNGVKISVPLDFFQKAHKVDAVVLCSFEDTAFPGYKKSKIRTSERLDNFQLHELSASLFKATIENNDRDKFREEGVDIRKMSLRESLSFREN